MSVISRNQKDRRHSGRVTPRPTIKDKKFLIEECLEPREHYSEWDNYRDGMRDLSDRSRIKKIKGRVSHYWGDLESQNKKLRRQARIRRAKKNNPKNTKR